jgi:hypothetical protein
VRNSRSRRLGDALVFKVREGGRVVNVHALLATGVNGDGHSGTLGLQVTSAEDGADSWACDQSRMIPGLAMAPPFDARLPSSARGIPARKMVSFGVLGMAVGVPVRPTPFTAYSPPGQLDSCQGGLAARMSAMAMPRRRISPRRVAPLR